MTANSLWRRTPHPTHIPLAWGDLPTTHGALIHQNRHAVFLLDRGLDSRTRDGVLAHERVYVARGIPCHGAAGGLAEAADRAVADWLTPPDELDQAVADLESAGETVPPRSSPNGSPDAPVSTCVRPPGLLGVSHHQQRSNHPSRIK